MSALAASALRPRTPTRGAHKSGAACSCKSTAWAGPASSPARQQTLSNAILDPADNNVVRSSMWRGLLLTMLLAGFASGGAGQDSDRRDIEGKLVALEKAGKLQAIQLKDLKMLNEVLDDNFIFVDQDGSLLQ